VVGKKVMSPDFRALKDPVNQADRDSLYSKLSKLGRYTGD